LAASLAIEAGDAQTVGYAWSLVSGALFHAGRYRPAVSVAQRARTHAGATPAGIVALLEESAAAAAMGRTQAVIDTVLAAEEAHARLGEETWGRPGYGGLGNYHPANLKAFAGYAIGGGCGRRRYDRYSREQNGRLV
jgi:hypothetical protein